MLLRTYTLLRNINKKKKKTAGWCSLKKYNSDEKKQNYNTHEFWGEWVTIETCHCDPGDWGLSDTAAEFWAPRVETQSLYIPPKPRTPHQTWRQPGGKQEMCLHTNSSIQSCSLNWAQNYRKSLWCLLCLFFTCWKVWRGRNFSSLDRNNQIKVQSASSYVAPNSLGKTFWKRALN